MSLFTLRFWLWYSTKCKTILFFSDTSFREISSNKNKSQKMSIIDVLWLIVTAFDLKRKKRKEDSRGSHLRLCKVWLHPRDSGQAWTGLKYRSNKNRFSVLKDNAISTGVCITLRTGVDAVDSFVLFCFF